MINADREAISNYEDTLLETENSIKKLASLNIKIPSTSWINNAYKHGLLVQKKLEAGKLEEFTVNNEMRWMTTVVFGTLAEFNFIVSNIDKLLINSHQTVIKKLNEILKMPLMVIDEDANTGSNLGRNTLFELRLASRFVEAGYCPILYKDHPDLLVPTLNMNYSIECKRLFSSESFENLIKKAIKQLIRFSLRDYPENLGLVAVSISRYYHRGDKKISMESSESLGGFVDNTVYEFIQKNKYFIDTAFPLNIPAIIIEFSDFGEAERPYWINWMYLVGTQNKPELSKFNIIEKDLEKLLNRN